MEAMLTTNGQKALDRARKLLYELIASGDDIDRERQCAFFYRPQPAEMPVDYGMAVSERLIEDYVPRSAIEVHLSGDGNALRVRLRTSLRVLRDLLIVTLPCMQLSAQRATLLYEARRLSGIPLLWVLEDFDVDVFEMTEAMYEKVPSYVEEDDIAELIPLEKLSDLEGLVVLLATLRSFVDQARQDHPPHTSVRDSFDELWKHLCESWLWSQHVNHLLEEQNGVNTDGDRESDDEEKDLHKS